MSPQDVVSIGQMLGQFSSSGILGVIAVVTSYLFYKHYKSLSEERKEVLQSIKENTGKVAQKLDTLNNLINEKVTLSNEEQNKRVQILVDMFKKSHEVLGEKIDKVRMSIPTSTYTGTGIKINHNNK